MRNTLASAILWLSTACIGVSTAVAGPQPYVKQQGSCDGFPRLSIGMAPGYCAGLVFSPADDAFRSRVIKTPRMLLQLDDKRWLLTDLGAWTDKRGKIWLIEVDSPGTVHIKEALGGLSLPHSIAFGPDGKIYVAEMNRIFRFNPDDGSTTTVIDGLPGNRLHIGRHPLSHFVVDGNGDLLVNVGADTDQCADNQGVPLGATCPESEGADARGVIRRYAYLGAGKWNATPTVAARGLRNSLVLVRHLSGTILQGENSYDFAPTGDRPYDEVNVIREGAHYGWPYCYDSDQATPAWVSSAAMDCRSAAHEKPAAFLPPHAAPLGALYYDGVMFPALKGKLLMTWHGYRPSGSRLVSFDVDAKGVPVTVAHAKYPEYTGSTVTWKDYRPGPAAEPTILTPGWNLVPGEHPAGAPVAIAVARDGALWVTDDRNAAILRIAADRP